MTLAILFLILVIEGYIYTCISYTRRKGTRSRKPLHIPIYRGTTCNIAFVLFYMGQCMHMIVVIGPNQLVQAQDGINVQKCTLTRIPRPLTSMLSQHSFLMRSARYIFARLSSSFSSRICKNVNGYVNTGNFRLQNTLSIASGE